MITTARKLWWKSLFNPGAATLAAVASATRIKYNGATARYHFKDNSVLERDAYNVHRVVKK